MKARIQVLHVETKKGVGKKSGQPYEMDVCQCVVHGETLQVGELVLPKDHPKVTPGMYEGSFGVSVDMNKRIGGVLISLTPITATAATKAA